MLILRCPILHEVTGVCLLIFLCPILHEVTGAYSRPYGLIALNPLPVASTQHPQSQETSLCLSPIGGDNVNGTLAYALAANVV